MDEARIFTQSTAVSGTLLAVRDSVQDIIEDSDIGCVSGHGTLERVTESVHI